MPEHLDPQCDWDPRKAAANLQKHGIRFDEASEVFKDVFALVVPDIDHSNGEEREIIMGYSLQGRLLVVSFAKREGVFRIISARRATRKERRTYEEFNEGYI